jgi:hypothetical protein
MARATRFPLRCSFGPKEKNCDHTARLKGGREVRESAQQLVGLRDWYHCQRNWRRRVLFVAVGNVIPPLVGNASWVLCSDSSAIAVGMGRLLMLC